MVSPTQKTPSPPSAQPSFEIADEQLKALLGLYGRLNELMGDWGDRSKSASDGAVVAVAEYYQSLCRELEEQLGRLPNIDELSAHLKMSPKKVKIIRKAVKAYHSPTQFGGGGAAAGDGEMTINELVADTHNPGPDELTRDRDELRQLQKLLGQIDERAAKILKLRYGLDGEDPMTLKEIGERIGLTRERVRQIEHEALGKLRDSMMVGV
jgi:RNA polymerase primary sigma factor